VLRKTWGRRMSNGLQGRGHGLALVPTDQAEDRIEEVEIGLTARRPSGDHQHEMGHWDNTY